MEFGFEPAMNQLV